MIQRGRINVMIQVSLTNRANRRETALLDGKVPSRGKPLVLKH